jgi:E3 ubiquitin-protein ligase HERC2
MKKNQYKKLRINSSTSSCWYARFMPSYDQNDGTFRKSLTFIIRELHSHILPLLLPSTNTSTSFGPYKDRWIINPNSTSYHHLEMYRFMGALMAMAFRSGNVLDFKLAPFFWKKFCSEPLELEDLENFDAATFNLLKSLRDRAAGKADSHIQSQKVTFTTYLTGGTRVILKEKGDEIMVTDGDVEEYISLVLKARFGECSTQIQAIQSGFNVVFPSEVAKILSWEDIEKKVIGDPFNLDQLKKITEYSNMTENDEFGTKFWNILEDFSEEDRLRYYMFVCGRTRFPLEPKIDEMKHKVYLREGYYYSDHDSADICVYPESFNIYLPRYTTEEKMKEKLLEIIKTTETNYSVFENRENVEVVEEDKNADGEPIPERPRPRRLSTLEGSAPASPRPVERRNPRISDSYDDVSESDSDELDMGDLFG